MKKYLWILVVLSMLFAVPVGAVDRLLDCASISSSGTVFTTANNAPFMGIVIYNDTTNDCTAVVYPNNSAAGTKLMDSFICPSEAGVCGWFPPKPVIKIDGTRIGSVQWYVTITTGGDCYVKICREAK